MGRGRRKTPKHTEGGTGAQRTTPPTPTSRRSNASSLPLRTRTNTKTSGRTSSTMTTRQTKTTTRARRLRPPSSAAQSASVCAACSAKPLLGDGSRCPAGLPNCRKHDRLCSSGSYTSGVLRNARRTPTSWASGNVRPRPRPITWAGASIPPHRSIGDESPGTSRLQRMLANGTARPARRDLAALPAPAEGPPLSLVLADMRDSERY